MGAVPGRLWPEDIPQPIQNQLSDAFLKAIKSAPFQDYLKKSQTEDGAMGIEQFTVFAKQQAALTAKWYQALGMKK